MVKKKECVYSNCSSNSHYPDRLFSGIYFIAFPKPDSQLEKCVKWIKLCGGPKPGLNVENINKDTFVCSKHFVGGHGPTNLHPDPIPATSAINNKLNAAQNFQKSIQPISSNNDGQEKSLVPKNNLKKKTLEISIQTDQRWISEQQMISEVEDMRKQLRLSFIENNRRQHENLYLLKEVEKLKQTFQPTGRFCRPCKRQSSNEILQDFARNTGLQGIRHALRERSFLWLLAYLVCLGMSVLQSWNVAIDYFAGKTSQTFTINNARRLPFPSVTICSDVVLPSQFNFSRIKNYDKTITPYGCKYLIYESTEEKLMKNREALIKFIRMSSEEERMERGINIEQQFVLECKYEGHRCNFSDPNEIYIFNNPMVGNCFTFNPGFNTESSKFAFPNSKFVATLTMNSTGYVLNGIEHKTYILVHQSGSAPILDSETIIEGYPGQHIDIGIKMKATTFIKKWFSSRPSCVERTDEKYRERESNLFYQREKAPYLYSLEACMKSCEQDEYFHTCKLINPYTPPRDEILNETNATPTLPPIECASTEEIGMKYCDCPPLCRYVEYTPTIDTTELILPTCNSTLYNEPSDKAHHLMIVVRFLSDFYSITTEEVKYSIYEFLGIIGGNLSLWIGLCILSLLEVVEVGLKLLGVCSRKICCKDSQRKKIVRKISSINKNDEETKFTIKSNETKTRTLSISSITPITK